MVPGTKTGGPQAESVSRNCGTWGWRGPKGKLARNLPGPQCDSGEGLAEVHSAKGQTDKES